MDAHVLSLDLKFPSLPHAEIPQDAAALRAILAGERGLARLYERLASECRGEGRYLVRLLGRDFEASCGELLASGAGLLRSLGATEREAAEVLPPAARLDEVAAALGRARPAELGRELLAVASRALFCHQLVPWKSEAAPVHEHFLKSLEAEDGHIGVVELLGRLAAAAAEG
jgi:hypothetical protein